MVIGSQLSMVNFRQNPYYTSFKGLIKRELDSHLPYLKIKELDNYGDSTRFYHNYEHIWNMILEAKNSNVLSTELLLAIVFHDIVYDPKRNDNEEKSVEVFRNHFRGDFIDIDAVAKAILETKAHEPISQLGKLLCTLDLGVLYGDFGKFVEFENNIFKEYQFVDYNTYKVERIKVLEKLGVGQSRIDYVKYRTPKIAVYAGSFNPFHVGHYNVLEKAERIFDKVIIARGVNPDKNNDFVELPSKIQNRQIVQYSGLLTDFINELGYDVTLIRGLRNSDDLKYEMTQYQFLQDLDPKINVVSIFCDKQYEHISSSAIRNLQKYNKHQKYLL